MNHCKEKNRQSTKTFATACIAFGQQIYLNDTYYSQEEIDKESSLNGASKMGKKQRMTSED